MGTPRPSHFARFLPMVASLSSLTHRTEALSVSQTVTENNILSRFTPEESAPAVSWGDSVSRMLSSQGRVPRWFSSLFPGGFVGQVATPREASRVVVSQGGARTSCCGSNKFRHGWSLLQMPVKGTEEKLSGEFGWQGSLLTHPPTHPMRGQLAATRASGPASTQYSWEWTRADIRKGEKDVWGFEARQM